MRKSLVISLLLLSITFERTIGMPKAPLVINLNTIQQLHSVMQIDFASHIDDAGKIENGWFALSPDGDTMAVINRENQLVVWDKQGQLIDRYSIAGNDGISTTILDAAFNQSGSVLVSAHAEGGTYYVANAHLEEKQLVSFRFSSSDVPLRIWADGNPFLMIWLELSPVDYIKSRYVLSLNPISSNSPRQNIAVTEDMVTQLPSGPENDVTAYLRIGRIEPPYAVTITQDFLVKRWNLETGEVTANAQVSALPGAGYLTPDGRFFGWRDGESNALNLLDFVDGQNRVIAPLRSTYLPFLLLNNSGDVMIAVNVGQKPNVVAWITSTGERLELGEYRTCTRQPDMVRLSRDGTTLVIGCESGLDIWRI